MNSESTKGNSGGVIIKPSARKSIHSYKDDDKLRSNEKMGRYGLNKSISQRLPTDQNGSELVDKGVDEVDNVMSKMARQSSPLPIRSKRIQRSNSYSQDEDKLDENTTNVLSKSLPVTLPPHIHYSDESEGEDSYSNFLLKSRAEDESYHSVKNRSNVSTQQGSEMSSIRHTVVESSNLDMHEHGELISRYRDDVNRSGVMLVKEVDAVPSDLAMAFHYYCDEYDPLVKKSAIFFTLNKANCSNTPVSKNTHDFVEKCLKRKWKTVSPENIRPLLTRVVNVIIDLTSAF
ncbi:hypothetical protein HF086_010076 [Spodoptera exigua]|uniref:Uncharacterized protein n=1 Tax=Spodoptera exigua TaxID=7107 RepID=A0A922N263_SPOEX|nr:hypothetical protein HF086_010076 [Spodoptera exigua]